METNTHFPSYLTQFYFERGIFQTDVVQNIKYTFYVIK